MKYFELIFFILALSTIATCAISRDSAFATLPRSLPDSFQRTISTGQEVSPPPPSTTQIKFTLVNFRNILNSGRESAWTQRNTQVRLPTRTKRNTWQASQAPQVFQSSSRFLQQDNKDQIRNFINPWWTDPIGDTLPEYKNLIKQVVTVDNSQVKCTFKTFDTSKPSYLTMNIDQPNSVVYPGAFIRGNSIKTGAQPLNPLPISSNSRLKFDINSVNSGNIGITQPNSASVINLIKDDIIKLPLNNQVFLAFAKSQELPQVYQALNFNSRVAEKLGISLNSGDTSCRIYVFMFQAINQYSPARTPQDDTAFQDGVGIFLKNTFTLSQALQASTSGYWGQNNIPTYVDRVIYGRFFAVSVQQNQKNTQIYNKIVKGTNMQSQLVIDLLKQMFAGPKKGFVRGPFQSYETNYIQTGQWETFFSTNYIPNNPATLSKLVPIAYSLRDFKVQAVKFSNALKHQQCSCIQKPKPLGPVLIQLVDVWKSAEIFITKFGGSEHLYAWVGEGTSQIYDITNQLSDVSGVLDRIRIRNTVAKKHFLTQNEGNIQTLIWFGNDKVYDQVNICAACGSGDMFDCKINKVTKTLFCTMID